LSYQIGKRVVKLDFISLVNLIMARKVVCELIQNNLNTQRLTQELKNILSGATQQRLKADYKRLEDKLGGRGASEKVAELIFNSLH
jgi:lipid-A-disaccharide synthase